MRKLASASACVLALSVSACGSSSPDVPDLDAGGDAKAATGPAVTGAGYAFHVPSGWKDATSQVRASQSQVDKAYLAPQATDGFTPNVNVIVKKDVAPEDVSASDYEKAEGVITKALASAGASNVHVQPRLDLADETALHLTASAQQGQLKYTTDQYIAFHDKSEYIVTFSVPASFSEARRTGITQPSMASWTWS